MFICRPWLYNVPQPYWSFHKNVMRTMKTDTMISHMLKSVVNVVRKQMNTSTYTAKINILLMAFTYGKYKWELIVEEKVF